VVTKLDADVDSHWRREEQQRRAIRDVLEAECAPTDFVLMGDLDELVERDVLRALVGSAPFPVRLGMPHAIYFANWWLPLEWPEGPMLVRGSELREPVMRTLLGEPHDEWDGYRQRIVSGCGVHVSYLGGAEAVRAKFAGHPEADVLTARGDEHGHVDRLVHYGVHYEGRYVLRRVPRAELTPLLARLYEFAPPMFDFTPAPSLRAANALCGYAWLRHHGRLPPRVLDELDAHPRAVVGFGAPVFAAVHAVLARNRRRLPAPEEVHLDPIHLTVEGLRDAAARDLRCPGRPGESQWHGSPGRNDTV